MVKNYRLDRVVTVLTKRRTDVEVEIVFKMYSDIFDENLQKLAIVLHCSKGKQIFVHLETVLFCFSDDDWYLWSVFLKMVCSGMCQRGEVSTRFC